MSIISKINQNIINPIIIILFAIATVYFVFGILEYLFKSKNDPGAIKAGAKHMGWGLFGMFIMVSVFGLLQLIVNTLPIDTDTKENVNLVLPLN